jgi:hypothetical protein
MSCGMRRLCLLLLGVLLPGAPRRPAHAAGATLLPPVSAAPAVPASQRLQASEPRLLSPRRRGSSVRVAAWREPPQLPLCSPCAANVRACSRCPCDGRLRAGGPAALLL